MTPPGDPVDSYSRLGAGVYEDAVNKSLLHYGEASREFLEGLCWRPGERRLLDIGCGTGMLFDLLGEKLAALGITALGIDPAAGMLAIAREKHQGKPHLTFAEGSFERIPLPDDEVDRIVSVFALHWVPDIAAAAREMARVLKKDGEADLILIAKGDGARFHKAVSQALRKHLSFAEIMKTTTMVRSVDEAKLRLALEPLIAGRESLIRTRERVVHASFEEHMRWWQARAATVFATVRDKEKFLGDLREELEKTATDQGIPFDSVTITVHVGAA
ncbi:MAG: class I SAM-dependent methyltransferase [Magnetococcales bacterium]|nr:class I SAM-dependent methyltransferase [Magnetococcales bacterium]MBF0156267.1 class I SAM-dependent methyltransferase [Magnetococcales bacterium]